MLKKVLLIGSVLALVGSLILLNRASSGRSAPVERTGVTVFEAAKEPTLEAGVASVVSDADAETAIVRPTVQQLSEKFLTWELRDLIDQAPTEEDRLLVQEALNLRLQRAKALELSPSFETNMQRALK